MEPGVCPITTPLGYQVSWSPDHTCFNRDVRLSNQTYRISNLSQYLLGDVLGLLIDLERGKVAFSMNGDTIIRDFKAALSG